MIKGLIAISLAGLSLLVLSSCAFTRPDEFRESCYQIDMNIHEFERWSYDFKYKMEECNQRIR
jgi:hypothetical protein